MASSEYLLPKFSVFFCQGNNSQSTFPITPVASTLPPQKAKLEGFGEAQPHGARVCVLLRQLSTKFLRLEGPKKCFHNGKWYLCEFDRYL